MATESDTMAVLASVLADPAAAAQRLKDLNAARAAAEMAQVDLDKKLKEVQRINDDANATYKKASEERLASARELKEADERRRSTQQLLDKIGIREGEVGQREERAQRADTELAKRTDELALKARQLDERDASANAKEKEFTTKLADLDRKLRAIKDIAA